MQSTQIYLTKEEYQALTFLKKVSGKTMSALIRQAIDIFLENNIKKNTTEILQSAFGIWENRKDDLNIDTLRRSWDR